MNSKSITILAIFFSCSGHASDLDGAPVEIDMSNNNLTKAITADWKLPRDELTITTSWGLTSDVGMMGGAGGIQESGMVVNSEYAYRAAKLAAGLITYDWKSGITPTVAAVSAFAAASNYTDINLSADVLAENLAKDSTGAWKTFGTPEFAAVATFYAVEKAINDGLEKVSHGTKADDTFDTFILNVHEQEPEKIGMEELFSGLDNPLTLMEERDEYIRNIIEIHNSLEN